MCGKGVLAVAAVVLTGVFLSCGEGSFLDQDALSCCRCHDDSQTLLCPHECQSGYYRSGQLPLECSEPEINKREKRAARQPPTQSKSSDDGSKSSDTHKDAADFPRGQPQSGSKSSEGSNDFKPPTIPNTTSDFAKDQPQSGSKPTEGNSDSKPPTIQNNTAVVPVNPSRHNTTSQPPEWTESKSPEENNDSKSSEIRNTTTADFPTNPRQSSASSETSPAALTAVTCLPCHSTCKECAGPGKDNCTECPAHYGLIASESRFLVGLCQASHEDHKQLIVAITLPLAFMFGISLVCNALLSVCAFRYRSRSKINPEKAGHDHLEFPHDAAVPEISVPPYSTKPLHLTGNVSATAVSVVVVPPASDTRRSTDDPDQLCRDNERSFSAKKEKGCLTWDNSPAWCSSAENRREQSPLDSTNDDHKQSLSPNPTHHSGRRPSSGYCSMASSRPSSSKSATSATDEGVCCDPADHTDLGIKPTRPEKPLSDQPILCNSWQFSREITCSGGLVKKELSDVRLEVPHGAVDRDQRVLILGAVTVDLEKASKVFRVPEQEVIVSPVAEFWAGEVEFTRPVSIVLPYALPSTATQTVLKVYHFRRGHDRQVRVCELRRHYNDFPKTVDNAGFYQFDGSNTLRIFVNHFSGVFCTKCRTECSLPDLYVDLFAGRFPMAEASWNVDIRLKVWDNRIQDFRRTQDGSGKPGVELVDSRDLRAPTVSANPEGIGGKGMLVRLELEQKSAGEWTHRTWTNDSQVAPWEEIFDLKDLAFCEGHQPTAPLQTKDWYLTSTPGGTPQHAFQSYVEMGFVETHTRSIIDKLVVSTISIPHETVMLQRTSTASDVYTTPSLAMIRNAGTVNFNANQGTSPSCEADTQPPSSALRTATPCTASCDRVLSLPSQSSDDERGKLVH